MTETTPIEFVNFWKNGENEYQISPNGDVRSIKKGIIRTLRPYKHKTGELYIRISSGNGMKTFSIKRLIATHFITRSDNQTVVIYKDHNQSNCISSNLEWKTPGDALDHRREKSKLNRKNIVRTDVEMEVKDFDTFTTSLIDLLSSVPNNSSNNILIHI